METQTIESVSIRVSREAQDKLMFFERYVLKKAHPSRIFIDLPGMIWFFYFLWQNQAAYAILAVLISGALGYAAVRDANPLRIGETTLGKIALLHLHPVNFAVQILGFVVLMVGTWQHATILILAGVSIVFLGHAFGWNQVHASFERTR